MGEEGPSSSTRHHKSKRNMDAALHNVPVNTSSPAGSVETSKEKGVLGHELDDVALAKILQEQERAFLALKGFDTTTENIPPQYVMARHVNRCSEQEVEGSEDVPLTDEELAWQLMQQEEQEFQSRMMAMAGIGTGGAVDRENSGDPLEEDSEEELNDPDNFTYEELTVLGDVVGTVAAGLKEDELARLPLALYSEARSSVDTTDPCVICQLEFELDDEVNILPCKHLYHPECIKQWFARKKGCPQCGKEVSFQ